MKKITILIGLLLLSVGNGYAQETERYNIRLLDTCNTKLSNFGTSYYGADKIVFASPDTRFKIIKDVWDPNQQPFLDLFIGDISEDGEIINSKQLVGEVKTKYHEADAVFTKDLKTVYFTRDNYYKQQLNKDNSGVTNLALFKADVNEKGNWVNVVPFPFNNPNFSVGHPALSPDDQTLYFISDMPNSLGKTDIYKVDILGNNEFSNPKNLGPTVNTSEREMFVFISNENVMYFASDGWKGEGALDIFACNLNIKGIKEPTNLGAPINSYLDDFAFLINDKNEEGYFSSNRGGGKGDDDIYYFKQNKPLEFKCEQLVTGIVTDKDSGDRIAKALVSLYDENGNELNSQIVQEDARYSFTVECSTKYKIVAFKETYKKDEKTFTSDTDVDKNKKIDLELEKKPEVDPKKEIVVTKEEYDRCQTALNQIDNIYFDLDQHYIREDAKAELNKVVIIMRECENINIEVSSHTDSRAPHQYNQRLSQRRAQSTVDYITSEGIAYGRIRAVGYGETNLLNKCADGVSCTEAEHQMNRRTEFKVTNY